MNTCVCVSVCVCVCVFVVYVHSLYGCLKQFFDLVARNSLVIHCLEWNETETHHLLWFGAKLKVTFTKVTDASDTGRMVSVRPS